MNYLYIALVFLAAAGVIILLAKQIASHKFKCKHCSNEFRIDWLKVIITEHSGSEYKLMCPLCKTKDWCAQQPGNTVVE